MQGDGKGQRPSAQARALSVALRLWVRPFVQAWTRAPRLPWPYWAIDQVGRLTRPAPGTRMTQIRLPHCRAQWIDARTDSASSRVILYLPGGAFLVGGWHLHRAFLSRLSRRTNAQVLSVDYRKLPRNEFAHAADDALDAYRRLLTDGTDPADIVVAGDSAGGYLALQLATRAMQVGLPKPSAVVTISPLLSLGALDPNCRRCAVLTPRALAALTRFTGVDPDDGGGPMGLANAELPPVLLHAAANETLSSQVMAYEKLLTKHRVPHRIRFWPLDIHVFHAAHWLPEAHEALDSIAEFLDDVAAVHAAAVA